MSDAGGGCLVGLQVMIESDFLNLVIVIHFMSSVCVRGNKNKESFDNEMKLGC